jgi:hypothetical protein
MFAGLSPGLDYDFAMLRLVLLALLPQIGGILLLVGRSLLGGEGTVSRIRQCRHAVRIWHIPVESSPSERRLLTVSNRTLNQRGALGTSLAHALAHAIGVPTDGHVRNPEHVADLLDRLASAPHFTGVRVLGRI